MTKKYNIPFSPPDLSGREKELICEVLDSGWITTGPKTKEFERKISEYCHTPKAVCLNSATACLELTLRILGVGPGDEVITSAYTYTATASVIAHTGATIVLIDTVKDTTEMDLNKLELAINEHTKVIIPVDIAGIMCDYQSIYDIVERNKYKFKPSNDLQRSFSRIAIMADGAHSFGAMQNGLVCGEVADFTCFSFHAVKNLTTAEGGAVVWKQNKSLDNDDIYKQYQLLSLHGQTKDAFNKTQQGSWEYDIIDTAYKCNMTDVMSAIGLAQMERYDEMIKTRHQIIGKYNKYLLGLPFNIEVLEHSNNSQVSSGHLYFIRIKTISEADRNGIIEAMAQKGIACNVHYKPLPLLTAYKKLGFDIKDYPNAYDYYHNEITLPLRSNLKDYEVDYILASLREVLEENVHYEI